MDVARDIEISFESIREPLRISPAVKALQLVPLDNGLLHDGHVLRATSTLTHISARAEFYQGAKEHKLFDNVAEGYRIGLFLDGEYWMGLDLVDGATEWNRRAPAVVAQEGQSLMVCLTHPSIGDRGVQTPWNRVVVTLSLLLMEVRMSEPGEGWDDDPLGL